MRRLLPIAAVATVPALLGAGAMIFLYAPPDAVQGDVQRIFYVHVSSVIAAYFCFAAVLLGGAAYLWRGYLAGDRLARAAAPVGLVLTAVCLLMGSIWARPIWGVYWTWDARLTSTLVLFMVYAGYLLVRRLASSPASAARLGAVVGIVGFVDVPVVHGSVEWWRTVHPQPIIDAANGPQMPPQMTITFLVTLAAFTLLTAVLVAVRYQIEESKEEIAELRRLEEEAEVPVAARAAGPALAAKEAGWAAR
ncbi:MAG: cytochrome c biogenesis protein CcsA [Candidatus Dormibacterales bacterium]